MKLPLPLTILLFLSITSSTMAQTEADAAALTAASWQTTKLDNGLIWKKLHLTQKELFVSNQSINIAETRLRNRKIRFRLATADSLTKKDKTKGVLLKTSHIALQNNALVAINGGFFDVKKGGSVDFFKVDGHVTDTTRGGSPKALTFHSMAAITIHKNKLEIVKGENRWRWEQELKADHVLLSGPLLIDGGQVQALSKTPFNDNRHPRTCLCITNDERLLLITVDGRSSEAYGMSLPELTFLAQQLKCRQAINLDGGGSTTLYIAGQPESGVVNYPCDNKLFDHAGERAVSNIFLIKKR